MNRRTLILGTGAAAIAAFGAATWWMTRPQIVTESAAVVPKVADRLTRAYSPVLGSKEAPVTITEFFDPACEACRAFHPIVKDILAQHDGQVRVVLRYTAFHGEGSEQAIKVLEAARLQGVFEPVLEAILRNQPRWASHGAPAPGLLLKIAESVGLDAEAAQTQMMMPDIVAILNQDSADVKAVGVRQTPTFFVNGKPLDPFGEAELRALVASEVEALGS